MYSHQNLEYLLESFNRVHQAPEGLQREYQLRMEAQHLDIAVDNYRRLYKIHVQPKAQPEANHTHSFRWWNTPDGWEERAVKLLQTGVMLTIAIALGQYLWETPKRDKFLQYQAWQVINSAAGQRNNAGRIEALQDLNNDGVSLAGLKASGISLRGIDLRNANLADADLSNADLSNAVLTNADLTGADLNRADLRDARWITPHQIKKAKNWESACYRPDFRIGLKLSGQNPVYCAGES